MPDLSPEIALILACARPPDDPEAVGSIAAICAGGPDWDTVIAEALRHGVLPMVSARLLETCGAALPAPTRGALHAHVRSVAGNNLLLASQMGAVLDLLSRAGIDALPLKGPSLAQRIHGDVLHREFYDLDILVRREDVRAAHRVLTANGYFQDDERPPISDGPLPDDLHIEMRRAGLSFMLELHWALSTSEDALPVEFDGLWARRSHLTTASGDIPTLNPPDELAFLCVHAARHGWDQLKQVCDVAGLARASAPMDWQAALRTGREWGTERALLLGLLLARRVLGLELPVDVVARGRCIRGLTEVVAARLFAPPRSEPARLAELHLMRLRLRDSGKDRLRYILRLLRPHETERILMPLPRRLRAAHFVARPVRLLAALVASRRRGSAGG